MCNSAAQMTETKAYLPSSWDNDQKMTVLFSPLCPVIVNPEGMTSKIIFWKACIDMYLKTTGEVSFTLERLNKAFMRQGKKPQCLQAIIEEMMRCGELYELQDFLNQKPLNGSSTWSEYLWEIGKVPITWSLNSLKKKARSVLKTAQLTDIKYVHKEAVQNKADTLLLKTTDMKGEVMSVGALISKLNYDEMQTEQVMLALFCLYLQNKVALLNFDLNVPTQLLVKFPIENAIGQITISEADICKHKLSELGKKTELKIADYEAKCEKAREEARALMTKKSKVLALSQLRKKKMFEQIIEKEANILNNIHHLIERLYETESNIEVIDALRTANAALKNTQKEADLTEDSVLEVMDDLRDTIETQEDINSAISQPVFSDADVEKELAELEESMAREAELSKWVEELKLPDISPPVEAPSTPTGRPTVEET